MPRRVSGNRRDYEVLRKKELTPLARGTVVLVGRLLLVNCALLDVTGDSAEFSGSLA